MPFAPTVVSVVVPPGQPFVTTSTGPLHPGPAGGRHVPPHMLPVLVVEAVVDEVVVALVVLAVVLEVDMAVDALALLVVLAVVAGAPPVPGVPVVDVELPSLPELDSQPVRPTICAHAPVIATATATPAPFHPVILRG